jgi:hypothetical protein
MPALGNPGGIARPASPRTLRSASSIPAAKGADRSAGTIDALETSRTVPGIVAWCKDRSQAVELSLGRRARRAKVQCPVSDRATLLRRHGSPAASRQPAVRRRLSPCPPRNGLRSRPLVRPMVSAASSARSTAGTNYQSRSTLSLSAGGKMGQPCSRSSTSSNGHQTLPGRADWISCGRQSNASCARSGKGHA